tara:strand:+ start:43 stop:213 length:171 start_codon:yes stop_codon:yes gene_type:complete
MFETIFITLVVSALTIGVVSTIAEEVVVPAANKVVEVTTPVVEQAIEYVLPSTPEE